MLYACYYKLNAFNNEDNIYEKDFTDGVIPDPDHIMCNRNYYREFL